MKEIALDPQSPGYLLLPLLAIFEQIVLDTKTFLEQASNEILKIVRVGLVPCIARANIELVIRRAQCLVHRENPISVSLG